VAALARWHVDAELARAVAEALGAEVTHARGVSGGDINDAVAVTLGDGREVFVKTNAAAPAGLFAAEARGLRWLAAARALPVPEVLAVGARFLVLALIRSAPRGPGFDDAVGRGLAVLHHTAPEGFGLDHDNFIGRLPQSNAAAPKGVPWTWAEFYRQRRLEPQLRRATDGGLLPAHVRADADRVLDRLGDLVGPPEPPARLHGDLWGGNLMSDEHGRPCLIDPAVYGGHREVDLAMMRLFGGFGARSFAAYDEAFPLCDGHEERVDLYQLYPLLVHVNLFGGSYVGAVAAAVSRYR
jgi:fructosamine-3-kinase